MVGPLILGSSQLANAHDYQFPQAARMGRLASKGVSQIDGRLQHARGLSKRSMQIGYINADGSCPVEQFAQTRIVDIVIYQGQASQVSLLADHGWSGLMWSAPS